MPVICAHPLCLTHNSHALQSLLQLQPLMQAKLKAACKALKESLKELDAAQTDRSNLQHQVNKLSHTLQVGLK